MTRAAIVVALLMLGACREADQSAEQQAQEEHLDSLVETSRARPVVPLEFEDVRIGTAPDSLRLRPDSATLP